jgi:hypothetical protein
VSSRLKQAVADGLANYIAANIPGLAPTTDTPPQDRVVGGWADEEAVALFPSAAILPDRLQMTPFQEDEADDSDPNVLVISVGELEGTTTIRLYAKSKDERSDVEDQITNLFYQEECAQRLIVNVGTVTLSVTGSPTQTHTLNNVRATFLLNGDQMWTDEMVFSKKRYTYLTLDVAVECYVARNIPDIDQLILAVQADAALDLSSPEPTSPSDPSIENISVPPQ